MKKMSHIPYNIVLVHPEIPQNTGGIGRLCVSTGTRLHLIRPLGFSLDDKYVRRAGMDYWAHLDLSIYDNWEEFLDRNPGAELFFLSTHGTRTYWDTEYAPGCYLVFGRESSGLPQELYTPIFAIARIVGWSAHRIEELVNTQKIIRPAYMEVTEDIEYVDLNER